MASHLTTYLGGDVSLWKPCREHVRALDMPRGPADCPVRMHLPRAGGALEHDVSAIGLFNPKALVTTPELWLRDAQVVSSPVSTAPWAVVATRPWPRSIRSHDSTPEAMNVADLEREICRRLSHGGHLEMRSEL